MDTLQIKQNKQRRKLLTAKVREMYYQGLIKLKHADNALLTIQDKFKD